MSIETRVIGYLTGELSVPVSGDIPHPMPPKFVTVEKTGGGMANRLPHATIAVQSWAETRDEADSLNEQTKAAMLGLVSLDSVSRCALDADYNYTDEETRRYRYQAVFDVAYYDD